MKSSDPINALVNRMRFDRLWLTALVVASIVAFRARDAHAQNPQPRLDYAQQLRELEAQAHREAERAYLEYVGERLVPGDAVDNARRSRVDNEALAIYTTTYKSMMAEHARIPQPERTLEHELDRKAKAIFDESFKIMGVKDPSAIVDVVRYSAKVEPGSAGRFYWDKDTGKRILEIGPDAFREFNRTGRLLTACHEIQHAIDFDRLSHRVANWYGQRHGVSESEALKIARDRVHDIGTRNISSTSTEIKSINYARSEIRVEKIALERVKAYLGEVCPTLEEHSSHYQSNWKSGLTLAKVLTRSLTDDEADEKAKWFAKMLDPKTPVTSGSRAKNRIFTFQSSLQGYPSFGGVVLGNASHAPDLRLISARIALANNRPRIEFNVETKQGNMNCRYEPSSTDEFLAAYRIVHPDLETAEEFLLDGTECELVHCELDETGLFARFAIHPAMAGTALGRSAYELDCLVLRRTPGLFEAVDPKLYAMQWYDEKSVFRVDGDRLVVESARGPKNVLLRARFWGPSPEVYRHDAPGPAMLKFSPQYIAEAQRGFHDQLLFGEETVRSGGQPLTKELAAVRRESYDRTARDRHSDDLPLDSGREIAAVYDRFPAIRSIDQFARTLAVLRWISDHEEVEFPELPAGIQAVPAETPHLMSLGEISRLSTESELKPETFPGKDASPGVSERWYAAYRGDARDGWLRVREFNVLDRPGGTRHFVWETERVVGLLTRVTTVHRRDSRYTGKLDAFRMQGRVERNDGGRDVFGFSGVRRRDEMVFRKYEGGVMVQEDITPWEGRVAVPDILCKLFEHQPVKPGGTPLKFTALDLTYGGFLCDVEISPRTFEMTDVLGTSRNLLRVDVDFWSDQSATPSQPHARRRIAHETKWIDERGVIVKFEATNDEAVLPVSDKAKPADSVPFSTSHPDFVLLKSKYGVTDADLLGLAGLTDKPLELRQALVRQVISREEASFNVALALGDENKIQLHSGRMQLAKLELANLQQQIANGQTDSGELDFVANVRRNSWVREELVSRRGFQFLPDSTVPTTFHLSTREQALADDPIERTKNQFQRFPTDVPVFQPATPLGPSDLVSEVHLRVTFRAPVKFPPFSSTLRQTVKRIDDRVWEVVLRDTAHGAVEGTGPESLLSLCRQSTPAVESNDPAIIAFARSIPTFPGPIDNVRGAAHIIHNWIGKSYQYAFATAAETLARREGDCKGHAFLLAAVLRARGIPARIATGFRYVTASNTFVGHAWTEAWIEGRWLPFDASNPTGEIDAGYLQTYELPDMLLPLKAEASVEIATGPDGIERVEVLDQVFRSSRKRVESDGPPVEAVVDESSLTPLLPRFHNERTAFLLGLNLLRGSYLSDLYGPNHVSTASLRRQCDAWAAQLGVTIPEPSAPTLESEVAWINGARFILHRVRPYLAAQLQARHGTRITALFQTGLHASLASELDILLPPARREEQLRLFNESAAAANLDLKGTQEFVNTIRELYGSDVSDAPLGTGTLGDMLAPVHRRVEQASRLRADYASRVTAEIDARLDALEVPPEEAPEPATKGGQR